MLSGQAPFILNWMEKGQLYDVDVYLSHHGAKTFFDDLKKPKKKKAEPIWSLRDLTYSLDHEESNWQNTTVDLDLDML